MRWDIDTQTQGVRSALTRAAGALALGTIATVLVCAVTVVLFTHDQSGQIDARRAVARLDERLDSLRAEVAPTRQATALLQRNLDQKLAQLVSVVKGQAESLNNLGSNVRVTSNRLASTEAGDSILSEALARHERAMVSWGQARHAADSLIADLRQEQSALREELSSLRQEAQALAGRQGDMERRGEPGARRLWRGFVTAAAAAGIATGIR